MLSPNKQTQFLTGCMASVISVFLLAVIIPSLVIAYNDGNNQCQGDDPTGLNLKDWLVGYAAANIFLLGMMWILIAFISCNKSSENSIFCSYILIAISVSLYSLFSLAWFILGIVLLARSDGKCLADSEPIGSMVLAALVLELVGSNCFGLLSKNEK